MTVQFRSKPPKIGQIISLNGVKWKIADWHPLIGYSPKRYTLEIVRVKSGGKK